MAEITEAEIEALGSPQRIQRFFEDEMDLEVLRNLTAQVVAALGGDAGMQEELRAEWADTKAFAERLANRPLSAVSPLLKAQYAEAVEAWRAAAARVG